MKKTVCELFAGVGGFRLGLKKASDEWNIVWANQWEPGKKVQHAFNCYCHHFGKNDSHVNRDIAEIDKNDILDHNLLVGGFPCQDYSVARTGAQGITGVKGVLWWQIREILEVKQANFVLLENVDRLIKSPAKQRGRDFGVMLACFNDLGYSVEWRVINAAEYGFVQRRRRIFIFAYKNTTRYFKEMIKLTNSDIINKNGFFATTFPIEKCENIKVEEFKYEDIVDVSDNFKYEFCNSGIMRNGEFSTCKTTPEFINPLSIKDIMEKHVDEKYYLGKELSKWEYLKGAKKIQRVSKTGHSYTFSEGAIAFPDSIDKPARTILTSESSVNRSTHVIRDIETNQLRLLTPIEAERIQGFADNWTNTGMPEKFRYFCMGNALVVDLVEKMGKTLNTIFDME